MADPTTETPITDDQAAAAAAATVAPMTPTEPDPAPAHQYVAGELVRLLGPITIDPELQDVGRVIGQAEGKAVVLLTSVTVVIDAELLQLVGRI